MTLSDLARAAVTRLPPEPSSPRQARQFVTEYCRSARLTDIDACFYARLLVSELVTNAVLHGRSEVRLQVSTLPGVLHVAVADEDSRQPSLQEAGVDALGGRGLPLVDGLASSWGVSPRDPGKAVWFQLPLAA